MKCRRFKRFMMWRTACGRSLVWGECECILQILEIDCYAVQWFSRFCDRCPRISCYFGNNRALEKNIYCARKAVVGNSKKLTGKIIAGSSSNWQIPVKWLHDSSYPIGTFREYTERCQESWRHKVTLCHLATSLIWKPRAQSILRDRDPDQKRFLIYVLYTVGGTKCCLW